MRSASILVAALLLGGAGASAYGGVGPASALSDRVEAKSSDLSVLLGWSVFLDASGTQGHPTRYEWCVARPGSGELCETYSTDVAFSLQPDEYGEWQVHLDVFYAHYTASGVYQAPRQSRTIDVKTVTADLDVPEQVFDNEQITFDGSESAWAQDVRPAVTWLVDGISYCDSQSPPTDPNEVRCTLDAALFTLEDTHVVTLVLTDAESGDSDSEQEEFVVLDDTISVDFDWSEPIPFDHTWVKFDADVWPSGVSPITATWDFGDGSQPELLPCSLGCLDPQYQYPSSGWYTVTVTVDVGEAPPFPTVSHDVPVDDPPEPLDAHFTATPQPASVMQSVTFSTDEPCADCTYGWSFGDDSSASSEASPTHTYQRSGTFTASLSLSRDSEADQQSEDIQVDDCGSPPAINQYGHCFGGEVLLEVIAGRQFHWSTGEGSATIQVHEDGLYWVSVEDLAPPDTCWATAEHLVAMDNCGSTDGDANLDENTNAADIGAVVAEITDGDGTSVVTSSWGVLAAPGGDVNRDGILDEEDIIEILELLFSGS